ncbi:GNAT family N-acetyltransferase [Streptomyces sp. NPDC049687]|uniref:GNAT family N-acetyltransferase n=1 Tax=Streptomyces sp. NPDC049687 TaxID=3365596 RepID=UPI0037A6AD7D
MPPTPAVPPVVLRADATSAAPALALRPWRATDVAALTEVFRDPVLRRRVGVPAADAAGIGRWIEAQRRDWEAGERFGFAVVEAPHGPAEGRLLGHSVLKEVAPCRSSAEVGYWTAAHARGRGVAPRALETLTRWAFDTFAETGLNRLDLLHQVDNEASCRVAEKAGYTFDSTLPAAPPAFPLDGHLHVRDVTGPSQLVIR